MNVITPVDDSISLRLIEPQLAETVYEAANTNREHIAPRLPWLYPGYNLDDAKKWTQDMACAFTERRELAMAIFEHDRFVGLSGWNGWFHQDNPAWNYSSHQADIGYWLIADAQGRGIVTRAVRKLLDMAFSEYAMQRMTIRAEPDNTRSWAVAERLGFAYEGTLRHTCRWNDRWVDHRLYAMLSEEWTNKTSWPKNPPSMKFVRGSMVMWNGLLIWKPLRWRPSIRRCTWTY